MEEINTLPNHLRIPTVVYAEERQGDNIDLDRRIVCKLGTEEVLFITRVLLHLVELLPVELFPMDLSPKIWLFSREKNPSVLGWYKLRISVSTKVAGEPLLAESGELIRDSFFPSRTTGGRPPAGSQYPAAGPDEIG